MTDKKHRVFVYGTLKRGIHNHHLLSTADFVGQAITLDEFRMYDVGFPIIRDDIKPGNYVLGEVYDVDDATLKRLDSLEAEGVMYDRKQINIENPLNGIIDANVYVYVGRADYWDNHNPRVYDAVNVDGLTEWRPA